MKKTICMIMIVVLVLVIHSSFAEGLLPSLSETVGIAMPSLGDALKRYPDSETENEDGSITELFTNVSEADFNTFSVYLETQGASLTDYQVKNGLLTAKIQAKGASFQLSYDSRSREAKVIYLSGTYDERVRNAKTRFNTIQELLKDGKVDEAVLEILAIPQYESYSPVLKVLQNDDNLSMATANAARSRYYGTVGNEVIFGRYEQDNIIENGTEDIEWIVLDVQDKKALLLSKYGLDAKPFEKESRSFLVSEYWENSSVRTWLNDEFLKTAFNEKEVSAILKTHLDNNSANYSYYTDYSCGDDTEDRVFFLSSAEKVLYLPEHAEARVAATAYAIANGAYVSEEDKTIDGIAAGYWWLRTPTYYKYNPACVQCDGDIGSMGATADHVLVRPALWLNLGI